MPQSVHSQAPIEKLNPDSATAKANNNTLALRTVCSIGRDFIVLTKLRMLQL